MEGGAGGGLGPPVRNPRHRLSQSLAENPNTARRDTPAPRAGCSKNRAKLPFPPFGTGLVILPATAAMVVKKTTSGSDTMFNMNEFKQGLVAAVAALVFTATAVGAAVGPAEAVDAPIFANLQIDGTVRG
jgi:hypothetical protein